MFLNLVLIPATKVYSKIYFCKNMYRISYIKTSQLICYINEILCVLGGKLGNISFYLYSNF